MTEHVGEACDMSVNHGCLLSHYAGLPLTHHGGDDETVAHAHHEAIGFEGDGLTGLRGRIRRGGDEDGASVLVVLPF